METPPVASGESETSNVPSNESQFCLNRPEGRQKRGGETTSDPSNAAWERRLDELVANSQEHTRLTRERDEREKASDARDKRKQDMNIMMMDISQVSPRSQPWFQAQKRRDFGIILFRPKHNSGRFPLYQPVGQHLLSRCLVCLKIVL
ncbi:hypothetical protein LINPERHAP2_LOCUS5794 [Linum perenne]